MIEAGKRYYHLVFGWCKVIHPPNKSGKVLVDLEADEIEYYVIGKGRVSYSRDKKTGEHILYTPVIDLLESDKVKITREQAIKQAAYGAVTRKWKK